MIFRFAVTNHSSLHLEQEVSFVATRLKDAADGLLTDTALPSENLLPVVVIYGANASGKTSTIDALAFIKRMVLSSHSQGNPTGGVDRNKFKLGIGDSPSLYEIDFETLDIRYQYGFSCDDKQFLQEWLYSYPQGKRVVLFNRSGPKEIDFGRSLKGRNRVVADLMRANSLFLSTAFQNSHEGLSPLAIFFEQIEINRSISVAGQMLSARFGQADVDDRAIAFLSKIGTGVTGSRRSRVALDEDTLKLQKAFLDVMKVQMPTLGPTAVDKTIPMLELRHRGVDGREVYFDPDLESSGTRRLLLLVSQVFRAIDRGSILIVDELDASVHTMASELLISLFNDKNINQKGAQLLATTHDTNLMLSSGLRRDQIWFAEKDREGSTHLFPLSDFQTRKGDNLEKGYLQGRFGAIPFAGSTERLLKKIA